MVISVCGGVVSGVSTVHVKSAAVASTFPAASIACTWKVCGPTARPVKVVGEVHVANASPSSAHANVEPGSLAEKVKLALLLVVVAAGPESIVVSGGTASTTVQVWVAGVGSTLPASSVATVVAPWWSERVVREGCVLDRAARPVRISVRAACPALTLAT